MLLTAKNRNSRNSDIPKLPSLFSYFSLSYKCLVDVEQHGNSSSPVPFITLLFDFFKAVKPGVSYLHLLIIVPLAHIYRMKNVVESPGLDEHL